MVARQLASMKNVGSSPAWSIFDIVGPVVPNREAWKGQETGSFDPQTPALDASSSSKFGIHKTYPNRATQNKTFSDCLSCFFFIRTQSIVIVISHGGADCLHTELNQRRTIQNYQSSFQC